MKKIILSAILLIAVFSGMNAQSYKWWIGGRTSLWAEDGGNTTFVIAPEIGYHLSPKFTLAASIGYMDYKLDSEFDKHNGFIINPYIRYTAFKKGIVLGFVDAGVEFGLLDISGVQVGFKPGIAILLTDRLTAATQFGFIGCNDGKGINPVKRTKGIGYDLSGYCSTIAFFYSF